MKELNQAPTQKIHRSQLKNAEYNPRTLTPAQEKKLRKSLKEFGLMNTLTWNKQTGNIVGGHQRIAQLDSIMRREDYELIVSVVDYDPAKEAKANIMLNQKNAQGEWDAEKLAEIKLIFPELSLTDDLAFEQFDLDMMFAGMNLGEEVTQAIETETQKEIKSELEQMAELENLKKAKREHKAKAREENAEGTSYQVGQENYMVTIVFPSNAEKEDFCARIGEKPDERYIKPIKIYDIQDGKRKAYG